MGATKKTYYITTQPLEEENFYNWKQKQSIIKDWKAEPDDKVIFENDTMYKNLLSNNFKSKKNLENYKYQKRNK